MGPKVHEHMTDRPRCVTPETPVTEAAELGDTPDPHNDADLAQPRDGKWAVKDSNLRPWD